MKPKDHYSGRTAPLTSKRFILYIYSTNTGTEYFKHGTYCPFFPLKNALCFIILTYLVPVLFTFYIQIVLKFRKNNSGAKRLNIFLDVVVLLTDTNTYCLPIVQKLVGRVVMGEENTPGSDRRTVQPVATRYT